MGMVETGAGLFMLFGLFFGYLVHKITQQINRIADHTDDTVAN